MAYYAIQSVFPALLFAVLMSLLLSTPESVTTAVKWVVDQGLDPKLAGSLETTLQAAAKQSSSGVGIAAVVAALTSLSSASGWLAAAGRAIEPDGDRRVSRNPVSGRIRFALWTVTLSVMLVLALTGLAAGGDIADWIFRQIGDANGAPVVWRVARPPLVLVGIIIAMLVLYRVAPDRIHKHRFRELLPGAITAGIGWVLASGAFAYYIRNLASLGATYGTFATPIIVLLWLWLSGVVVLLGAELNAELDRRRGGYHGLVRLPGADNPLLAGHPAGVLPDAHDDERLHAHDD
jgi:membrane protein